MMDITNATSYCTLCGKTITGGYCNCTLSSNLSSYKKSYSRQLTTYKKPKECRYCEHGKFMTALKYTCLETPPNISMGNRWVRLILPFNHTCGRHKFKQTEEPKYFGV